MTRGERVALGGVIAVYIALRAPLLFPQTILLGWNSDAGIFGMMAKEIFAGRAFPIFYWGSSYIGPMTSWMTVLVAFFTRSVDPFAMRAAALIEGIGTIVFFWLGLRRAFDLRTVAFAMLWVAIGPAFVLRFAIAPIGETMFFLSAVLFWLGPRNWVLFGLLSGFGWWVNQGVVFVIAGTIAACVVRGEWWQAVKPQLFRWRRIDVLLVVPLADALLGELHALGLHVQSFFLYSPVAEPLVFAFALFLLARLPLPLPPWRNAALFAVGFLIGYAPVIIGGLLHWYEDRYGAGITGNAASAIPEHIVRVLPDFVPFAIGLLALWGHRFHGAIERSIALFTIGFAFLFYLVSARVHLGQVRYMAAALPMVYAFAAEELVRWRAAGTAAALAFAISLAIPRLHEVRDVAEGRSEMYVDPGSDHDPRPIIANIERAGYRVCYADYWVAYKLEWVSGGKVQFIPWHSYDRTRERSQRLMAAPGPKCMVGADGTVSLASVPPHL